MQAIVKQRAFAAMILGPMSSEMCISCSFISAGVGMEAMLFENLKVSFTMQRGVIFCKTFKAGRRQMGTRS